MKVFAISDLHLSTSVEKPMNIFGDDWQNHFEKICKDWQDKVDENDIVLIGGDISWALTIQQAEADFELIKKLKGNKFVVRGNHDYYWNSLSKMQKAFPEFNFVQNNSYKVENVIISGSRGWNIANEMSSEDDKKIYNREIIRANLSLSSGNSKRKDGDKLICMMHYPPFEAKYYDTEMTDLFKTHNVDIVTYGHLHGKNVRVTPHLKKNEIDYFLTSCDLIEHKLVEIYNNNN